MSCALSRGGCTFLFMTNSEKWDEGSFGSTDAARINLADFISIGGVFADPHGNPKAMHDRIVVGRKGAGKTFYLRKLQDEAVKREFLTLSEVTPLSTETIVHFLKRIREYVYTLDHGGDFEIFVDRRKSVISVWRAIWDKAIILSAFSLALSFLRRSKTVKFDEQFIHLFKNVDELESYIIDRFENLFALPPIPLSPQDALQAFYDQFELSRKLHKFLNDPKWIEFNRICRGCVRDVPPIAIYIDAIDNEFENAPEAWLICQLGLYRSAAQSGFSHDTFSGRVHIVAALRDTVYAAALKSEHSTREYQNRFIRALEWRPSEVNRFFVEKLRRVLGKRASKTAPLNDLLKIWVGFDTLINGRDKPEAVSDYILRHGRMLPRDIVLFGNAITNGMHERAAAGSPFSDGSLRKAVAQVSDVIGRETIGICVNEVLSNSDYFTDYLHDIRSRPADLYDFRKFIEDKIARFFEVLGKETVTQQEIKEALMLAELASAADFAEGAQIYYRIDNVLWRHGLLAIFHVSGASKRWRYNWAGSASADMLPLKATRLGFHPCLIDVYDLKPSSDGPVY